MFTFIRDLSERHERLKSRIHSFRIPLSPNGQRAMSIVYFCVPVVCGYYIMQAVIEQSHKNLGVNGEKLLSNNTVSISKDTNDQNRALQVILNSHKKV